MEIVQELDRKKVGLRILNLGMDTQTPTGKLMLTVLGGIAQFEREMMLADSVKALPKQKLQHNLELAKLLFIVF